MEDHEPSQNQQRQDQQQSSKRSSFDTVQNFLNKLGKLRNKAQSSEQIIEEIGKNVVSNIVSPQKKIILIVGIILFFVLVFVIVFGKGGGFGGNFPTGSDEESPPPIVPPPGDNAVPIPGLERFEKSDGAPTGKVENGQNIIYTISLAYSGTQDVTVYDEIPANAKFFDASGVKKCDSGTTCNTNTRIVSWNLKDNPPERTNEAGGKDIYIFTLILTPNDNTEVINQAYATAQALSTGPISPSECNWQVKLSEGGGSDSLHDPREYIELMTCQGRNTAVLGDENTFTTTVINNDAGSRLGSRESLVRQIYRASIGRNVNPVAVMAFWGKESSFATSGNPFGCGSASGFDASLECAVNTMNAHMLDFENYGNTPVPYKSTYTCNYWNPFAYMHEAYTPICTWTDHLYVAGDGNAKDRENFTNIYKMLVGQ